MKISASGRVTVPRQIRERLGLTAGMLVEWEIQDDAAVLRKTRPRTVRVDGAALIAHMRGRGSVRIGTDEVLALTRGER
ncbi:MAG TPA: AbrB/MazE/SpoVT family DNA-binding domain-containing protein, partial [Longimicrobium sp.]|nr:AbrB/MazE/SpoVT family DNA-binding domain-containing protein [Longimicrobium sp.]